MRRLLLPLAAVLLCLAALPAVAAAQADVAVAVADSPDPVSPDGNITYTVTVSNHGPSTAPNVSLSSFGANNLRFQSATVPAGWNCTLPAPGTQTTSLSCTAASLNAGASSVLTFVMQADDALLGNQDTTIQFGFTAASSISDPSNANNSETESTAYVTPDADIGVTVTDSPDPVGPDQNVTYTATVINNGPDTATNVQLTVSNSGSLRFQSATAPGGWNCTTPAVGQVGTITCTRASVPSGASSVFTIVMRATAASAGTSDAALQTGFTVSSAVADPNGANNAETETTQYVVPDADVFVTASGPASAAPGGVLTYTLTLGNAGPDAAAITNLTVVLPAALRFTSLTAPAGWSCTTPAAGANGTINCSRASTPSGASGQLTLVTTVDPAHGGGPIATTFNVTSVTSDPDPGDNSATVVTPVTPPGADLGVTISAAPDPVMRRGTLTYTATVTNNGPAAAADVVLTMSLPAGLTLVSETPSQGSCTGVTCALGTIPASGSATVVITAQVHPETADSIVSTASVDASGSDPNPVNDKASVTTAVQSAPTLHLTASTSPTTSIAESAAFTFTLENTGLGAAEAVELAMTIPGGLLTLRQFAGPPASCTTPPLGQGGTATCTTPSLAPGGTLRFVLTVRPAGLGPITSTGTVRSPTPDTGGGSRTATATSQVVQAAAPIVKPKPDPCTSRRRFTLRLMRRDLPGLRVNLKGARVRSAVLRTRSGRTVRRLRFTARRVRVDLRRLKPGRYVVRLRVRLRNGRTTIASARYRTCRAESL